MVWISVSNLAIIFMCMMVAICQIYNQYENANYQNGDAYDNNMTREK